MAAILQSSGGSQPALTLAGVYRIEGTMPNDGLGGLVPMTAKYDPDNRLISPTDVAFPEAPSSGFPVDAGLIVVASGNITCQTSRTKNFRMEFGGGDFTNTFFDYPPDENTWPITLIDSYESGETFELGIFVPADEISEINIQGTVMIFLAGTWPAA